MAVARIAHRGGRRRLALALALALGLAGPTGAAPAPAPAPTAPAPAPATPAGCSSSPQRQAYVSLRATSASTLAAQVAECERLGYRRIGGVARAIDANPAAPAPELYFQVMIIPPGASAASAAAAPPAATAR